MRFSAIITFFAAGLAAATNVIEFVSQDSTARTITFSHNPGCADINPITLNGYETKNVTFPEGWIGNWWAKSKGSSLASGMLGEVAWNGWRGNTYFDVSAIVNPGDINGVKMMYPKLSETPMSGCQSFPCANAYNQPDDIQTLSTTESTIVCLIGNKGSQSSRRHARHFITGHPVTA